MALLKDPTKTTTIEKAWRREINRRTRRLQSQTMAAFNEMIRTNQIVNADEPFNPTDTSRSSFMNQLNIFLREYIGMQPPFAWFNRYQKEAYNRGNESSMTSLYPANIRPDDVFIGVNPLDSPSNAADRATLNALYNRAFNATSQWGIDFRSRVGVIIEAPGLDLTSVDDVRQQIIDRVGVMRSRNYVIAQTETIQANQMATINSIVRENDRLNQSIADAFNGGITLPPDFDLQKEIDSLEGLDMPFERRLADQPLLQFEVAQFEAGGYKLRWVSRADARVRELHRRFHGRLMSPERAQRNVQISPWNCRCSLFAVNSRKDTPKENAKWKDERQALIADDVD